MILYTLKAWRKTTVVRVHQYISPEDFAASNPYMFSPYICLMLSGVSPRQAMPSIITVLASSHAGMESSANRLAPKWFASAPLVPIHFRSAIHLQFSSKYGFKQCLLPLRQCDTHHWSESSLFQVMTCCLLSVEQLSEPLQTCCLLNH